MLWKGVGAIISGFIAFISGFLASACCIGPPLLATLGVSVIPLQWAPMLERFRPIFVGLTVLFLFWGYRDVARGSSCACGSPGRVWPKVAFGIVAAIAIVLALYPYILILLRR